MIENDGLQQDAQDFQDDECAEFQDLMSQRIGAGEDLQSFPHMLTCERCRALVYDLEQIAIAARELMDRDPSTELWEKVSRAIEENPDQDDDPEPLGQPALN